MSGLSFGRISFADEEFFSSPFIAKLRFCFFELRREIHVLTAKGIGVADADDFMWRPVLRHQVGDFGKLKRLVEETLKELTPSFSYIVVPFSNFGDLSYKKRIQCIKSFVIHGHYASMK